MGLGGTDVVQDDDIDEENHIHLSIRKQVKQVVNESDQSPTHPTNNSKGQGQTSPMGYIEERVMIASLGDGSFDPYGMNFNLPHVTTVLIDANNSSMDVDTQGSHGAKGLTRVEDYDTKAGNKTQPLAAPLMM